MVNEVFEYWKLVMQINRAKLDSRRRLLIRDRLDDGYFVADLKLAIEGCAQSAWHMGENDERRVFNSIETIFKSADKIDQFIGIAEAEQQRIERRNKERLKSTTQTLPRSELGDEHLRRIMASVKAKRERL